MTDAPTVEYFPYHVPTLETIDGAMWDHLHQMNIHVVGNQGFKKMPIIWASAERSYQIKHNKDLRDPDGTIILPVMTVERTMIDKSLSKKGSFFGAPPALRNGATDMVTIARQINQKRTSDEENALSYYRSKQLNFPSAPTRTVYRFVSIPLPVYLNITYSINIRTQYQQQMNQALAPFWTSVGNQAGINYFTISKDTHIFEAFMAEDFGQQNNFSDMGTDERTVETKFEIRVLGYVIGADANQAPPNIVVRNSAVKMTINNERCIIGQIPEGMLESSRTAVHGRDTATNTNPGTGKYPGCQDPSVDPAQNEEFKC